MCECSGLFPGFNVSLLEMDIAMKLNRLLSSTILIASIATIAAGCGLMETDSVPAAATPSATPDSSPDGTDGTDGAERTDGEEGEDESSANNAAPENSRSEEPTDEAPFEEGRHFYAQPDTNRCESSSERCAVAPSSIGPAVASTLDFMTIPEPTSDCDYPEEYRGNADGIACAFARLGPAVQDRIDASHFDDSFVFELYQEGTQWRLEVFKVGADGSVAPSSLVQNSARSHYGFDDVTVDDGVVTAEGGDVLIRTDYWDFPVEIAVRNARLEGTTTSHDGTVVLETAKITGHFEVLDLFANLNQQASTCAGEVNEPFTNDSTERAQCPELGRHSDQSCRRFDLFCPLFSHFAKMADVDLNDDGLADAFSVRLDVGFSPGERRF